MEAGYLGVGAMGQPMAHKLLDAGHSLTIYDINEAAMQRYAGAASEPKLVLWYDTGHELNDIRALMDRANWLRKYIRIEPVGPFISQAAHPRGSLRATN